MKRRLLLVLIVLVLTSLACSAADITGKQPTKTAATEPPAAVTKAATEAATEALVPTAKPTEAVTETELVTDLGSTEAATETETETEAETEAASETSTEITTDLGPEGTLESTEAATESVQACEPYTTLEFDGPSDCLVGPYYITGGVDPKKNRVILEDGMLKFEYEVAVETYGYVFYKGQTNTARLDAEVKNFGVNENGAALVCHYNNDGWYEARIASNGRYNVYYFSMAAKRANDKPKIYTQYVEAITDKVKIGVYGSGRANTYSFICTDDTLTLEINGAKIWSKQISNLIAGGWTGVGAMVTPNRKIPVLLGFDWLTVSQP